MNPPTIETMSKEDLVLLFRLWAALMNRIGSSKAELYATAANSIEKGHWTLEQARIGARLVLDKSLQAIAVDVANKSPLGEVQ